MRVSKTSYVTEHYDHPVIRIAFNSIYNVDNLEKIVDDFLKENHFDKSDSGVVFFSSEIKDEKIAQHVYSKCIEFVKKNREFKTWMIGDYNDRSVFISFK